MPDLQYLDTWTKLTVLVVGDAMLDRYLRGTSERLCQEAPVPVVDIAQHQSVPGGAANTAANVCSLGGTAVLLSVVGGDREGDELRQILQQRGIRTEHLLTSPSRTTLVKQRIFCTSQLLARLDWGSTEAISKQEQEVCDRLGQLFPVCDAVIVSDYGYGIITPRVRQALAQLQASEPRVVVVDSKNLEAYRDSGVTAVKPNYEQAIQLLKLPKLKGTERIEQITAHREQLLALTGAKLVAVTLDADGAVVFERSSPPYRTQATPVSNLQATGAGDTYVSALTLALTAGASLQSAASLAAAATGIVVSQAGTTTCDRAQLRQRLLGKAIAPSDLEALMHQHRCSGDRLVFTNGCFDIIHSGHVTYLKQAKALGDRLIVGVNADESVKKLKGPSRPVNPLPDRLAVLAALESVDYVIPFSEPTPIELIKIVRPDIYVKGGDYTPQTLPEAPVVEELGGIVKILPFVKDRSTTSIINRINQSSSLKSG